MSQLDPAATSIIDRSTFHQGGRNGILLIHGLGGTPVEMRFVSQALARAGFTVYCCQLAGHCGKPDELRRSTREEWCQSVRAAYDRLAQSCDTILAGGLSMGAMLALNLALEKPGAVHGLILLAPSLKLDGWSMPWTSRHILSRVRPTIWRSNVYLKERPPYGIKDERIRAFVLASMQSDDSSNAGVFSTPLHSFAHFNSLVARVRPRLGEITAPTLIIHPRHDDMADLANAITLQRQLAGLVELVVLDDSYHIITLDRQRHIVVDRVVAFAEALARRRGSDVEQPARQQRGTRSE